MPSVTDEEHQCDRGKRAEDVAEWYFRLNGFLAIPGFVVHIDSPEAVERDDGSLRYARTEADFIGVRFPHSREIVNDRAMKDDLLVIGMGSDVASPKVVFALVEVTSGRCKMNGP